MVAAAQAARGDTAPRASSRAVEDTDRPRRRGGDPRVDGFAGGGGRIAHLRSVPLAPAAVDPPAVDRGPRAAQRPGRDPTRMLDAAVQGDPRSRTDAGLRDHASRAPSSSDSGSWGSSTICGPPRASPRGRATRSGTCSAPSAPGSSSGASRRPSLGRPIVLLLVALTAAGGVAADLRIGGSIAWITEIVTYAVLGGRSSSPSSCCPTGCSRPGAVPRSASTLPGSILFTLGWLVLHVIGAEYVARVVTRSTALYGAIGAIFGVLAFLYATMWWLLFCAEVTQALREDARSMPPRRADPPRRVGRCLAPDRSHGERGAIDERSPRSRPLP